MPAPCRPTVGSSIESLFGSGDGIKSGLKPLDERVVYTSFPPGGVLQAYFLHRLLPGIPLVTLISVYGVGIQALVALIYGLLVLRIVKPEDRGGPAIFFPIATMLTYLFHPAPYYFHPMTPFAFQAAMVQVALATWLEYAIRTGGESRLRWLQSAILGWLAACDWSFITFGIALTVSRLLRRVAGGPIRSGRRYAAGRCRRLRLAVRGDRPGGAGVGDLNRPDRAERAVLDHGHVGTGDPVVVAR